MKIFLHFLTLFFLMNSMNAQYLIWADGKNSNINLSKEDGTEFKTLVSGNRPVFFCFNSNTKKIYWTDANAKAVFSINYDGTGLSKLISNLTSPKGICFGENNALFISDDKKINEYDVNGIFVRSLASNLNKPSDLHYLDNFIYYADAGDEAIYKIKTDGTGKVKLIDAYSVQDIYITPTERKLYYVQNFGALPGSGIFRVNLDGGSKELLISEFAYGVNVDEEKKLIYWSNRTFRSIYKTSFDNLTTHTKFVEGSFGNPASISIDLSSDKVFFLSFEYANFLYSMDYSTSNNVKVLQSSSVYKPTRIDYDPIEKKIYWANEGGESTEDYTGGILRADVTGDNIEKILGYPKISRPFGLALDIDNRKIYWTDKNTDNIGRSDLDGSNLQILVSGQNIPGGITIDKVGKKMYWSDWGTNKIQEANLDGSSVKDVVTTQQEVCLDVKISNKLNKLFWSNFGNGTFYSADINGGNINNIFSTSSSINRIHGFDIDDENEYIYYTVNLGIEKIFKSDYSGNINNELPITTGTPTAIKFLSSNPLLNTETKLQSLHCSSSPNPLVNSTLIESDEIIKQLIVYDQKGRAIINNLNLNKYSYELDLSSYPSGFYYVEVNNGIKFGNLKLVKIR